MDNRRGMLESLFRATGDAGGDNAGAFAAIGDLFVTGPTGTNVNDFRAILVDSAT